MSLFPLNLHSPKRKENNHLHQLLKEIFPQMNKELKDYGNKLQLLKLSFLEIKNPPLK